MNVNELNFDKGNGLVTVVAQDALNGRVLMVAHADKEALARTLETGEMHYHSRTRGLWHKGATSGATQTVVSLAADCDGDALLASVRSAGPACHKGTLTCFAAAEAGDVLSRLGDTIAARAASSNGASASSYTKKLLGDRNLRLKKIGEECAEFVTACADSDGKRVAEEAADVIYHTLVAAQAAGVSLDDIRKILDARAQ